MYSQSAIQVRSWGQAHGIESAVIYGVFQDKNQLIWICTYNGLYYFDGFRAYKSQILKGEEKIPYEGIVNQLAQSMNGRYWLKIDDRFGAYDIYTKVFTPLKTQPDDLLATFQSIGDQLYVVDHERTFLVDQKTLEIIQMVFVDDQNNAISNWVGVSSSSGKYFSFKDSVLVEVLPTKDLGRFLEKKEIDSTLTYLNSIEYFNYKVDVNGNSWFRRVGDSNKTEWMVKDSLGTDVTEKLMEPFDGMVLHFINTVPEYSWFLSDKGLILWEKHFENPRYLYQEIPELNESRLVNSFDKDKTNWIWNRQGIHHIRVSPTKFRSITKELSGTYSNFILGIFPFDDDHLLIKHDFFDPYHSLFNFNSGEFSTIPKQELFEKYSLEEYEENSKQGEPSNWIEKHGEHIHNFSGVIPNRNPFTRLFVSDGESFDYAIIPQDNTKEGNQLWSISSNKMVFPKIDPIQFSNQGDTVWIGTNSVGLVALHTPSAEIAQWFPDQTNASSIPSERVHAVIPVANGNLWLGTGKGLSYFDKRTGKFTTYRIKDGLIDDRIYCMAFDRKGSLWIGTNNGLSRFDTLSKSFTNFTKADGLVNSEYNRNSAILLKDGRMMFGGMEGIDLFDPDEVVEQIEKTKPLIAHVHNNDQLINLSSTLDFAYDENHFDFYVSANPIWTASTLTYQYRLDGADEEWQSLNFSNSVRYPNLPPGDYSFQVKIANQPDIAVYDFSIQPIWYATWWFRIAFVFTGLLIIYLVYRIMLARRIDQIAQANKIIQLKAEQAQSVTKERERIIADLHDDVGSTLSSLHIYGDLAGKVWESQPEKGKEMVDKIKEQSHDLMGRMSDIIWSMKSSEEEKQSFALRLKNHGTDLLASKNIEVIYEIDEELAAKIRYPEIRKNLLMVGKEAMNNIVKHSQAKKVKIQLTQEGNELVFKISDDGKGFDLVDYQMGNGLGNIQHRCLKMQGKFNVESVNGWGTQVSCRVPMIRISLVD
ncbi:sensor histidine kinase [Algoriphagus antarcticus]|uniref:sensor histidine kinase n=1 Tax=Algoriphagus antarcticus TaxID=238540 RepID=UPI0014747733|nr:two-component regulator propeller domain-containing protein [Algoriphagus antarcticus]